jgi:hypothetical protein
LLAPLRPTHTHRLKIRGAVEQKLLCLVASSQAPVAPVLYRGYKYGHPKALVTDYFFRYRALRIRLIGPVFSTLPPAAIAHFLPVAAGIHADVSCSSRFNAELRL